VIAFDDVRVPRIVRRIQDIEDSSYVSKIGVLQYDPTGGIEVVTDVRAPPVDRDRLGQNTVHYFFREIVFLSRVLDNERKLKGVEQLALVEPVQHGVVPVILDEGLLTGTVEDDGQTRKQVLCVMDLLAERMTTCPGKAFPTGEMTDPEFFERGINVEIILGSKRRGSINVGTGILTPVEDVPVKRKYSIVPMMIIDEVIGCGNNRLGFGLDINVRKQGMKYVGLIDQETAGVGQVLEDPFLIEPSSGVDDVFGHIFFLYCI
jgi:hypothetical protein